MYNQQVLLLSYIRHTIIFVQLLPNM